MSSELPMHFPKIEVTVEENKYQLEYANTFELRAQGLMFRKSLCENCGMLFEFDQPKLAGFWMKDTSIPLDIAFITASGIITDIKAMQPFELNSTTSSKQVLYAWEMNQSWFKRNNIKVGDIVIVHRE